MDIFNLLTPSILLPWLLGMAFGVFVGSTPGLTATMAVALLVPIGYSMSDPTAGLAMIIGVSFTAIFAGDIPATYLRIPGTPASTAATLDAHALAKQGRGKEVLQTNLVCSVFGGLVGLMLLVTVGPLLAKFALRFDDAEYFWLMIVGLLLCIMSCGAKWPLGLMATLLGILFATVGFDSIGNAPRYTFSDWGDFPELGAGINFIPAMIGLFGISEALKWPKESKPRSTTAKTGSGSAIQSLRNIWNHKVVSIFSALMGTMVGALPGAGADIAAWASYGVAQRIPRFQSHLGSGHIVGVIAPTSANNAAVAGAWIPALVFGLPGDSVTAIMIGAFSVFDIRPGPDVFSAENSTVQSLIAIAFLTQIFLIPIGLIGIRVFSIAMRLPRAQIQLGVIVFSFVGAYAVANSLFDVWVMMAFGALGLIFDRFKIPIAPLILGMILGDRLEKFWRSEMIASQGDIGSFFAWPESFCLATLVFALCLGLVVSAVVRAMRSRRVNHESR